MAKTRPCEICGEMIDAERVEALPETRLCGLHAREIEPHGGEIKLTASEERSSKQNTFKQQAGSVGITGHKRNAKAITKLQDEFEREGG